MTLDTTQVKAGAICGPACNPLKLSPHTQQAGIFGQVKEFFSNLFSTVDWPPRWHCGSWTDFHGWLYILSDLLIWASYFAIPILLFSVLKKRKDIPFPRIIWLFGAFIILCGVTHLMDAIIFWWPAYRLSALLRLLTGLVSTFTVYILYKVIPQIYSLRTLEDIEREMKHKHAIDEQLAQSEFLLSEAGRLGRLGGWEIDVLAGQSTWSKTVYEIYELPYDFPTKQHDIDRFFPEPYNHMIKAALANALKDGQKWDLEVQMLTAKGNLIWVRTHGAPLCDDHGKIIKVRGVLMDIHKYKTNELSLNRSIELISQHNMQLKSFAHILSHNIRNHASNISLLSSLVDESSLDENNAELFEKIKKVSSGLNTTLVDLSQAIKIRDTVLSKNHLAFEDVTRQVLHIIERDIEAADATIDISFEVKNINFPAIYLESIIINLLTNAIKYRRKDTRLQIGLKTYADEKGHTVLECSDNGSGIDLKLHGQKIFGLYKTFHDRKDAHGVGLFLIKTQVESQGGEIYVESTPDIGSTFIIKFNE